MPYNTRGPSGDSGERHWSALASAFSAPTEGSTTWSPERAWACSWAWARAKHNIGFLVGSRPEPPLPPRTWNPGRGTFIHVDSLWTVYADMMASGRPSRCARTKAVQIFSVPRVAAHAKVFWRIAAWPLSSLQNLVDSADKVSAVRRPAVRRQVLDEGKKCLKTAVRASVLCANGDRKVFSRGAPETGKELGGA